MNVYCFLDMAMDRMEQDENSWRQHFEDLPIAPIPKSDNGGREDLTQNLDSSNMSGFIAGEITVRYMITHFFWINLSQNYY